MIIVTSLFPYSHRYLKSVNVMVQKADLINSFTKALTTNQQSTETLPTEYAEACLDIDRPHIQIFAILMYLRNNNRVGLEIFNTFQVIEDTVRGSTKEGPTDLEKGQDQSQADVAMSVMALAPDRHER
ncbi:hypothetical protein SARC_15445 [Sphaeroforma arctica JP610]|uniref:Uncharacterized protein n=1 Tax=Sphaeroforma arctica JP610 TaxID=667725 RepID=A0A0L0F5Z1_9EUKA|nr:hypothetical protein SARC_15445 [Sphaeroforma arctica JP610]KNC72006.1 hypothetical protein SARC_15445 [Sphaeroforma arctica JP610]|eukprot:XP_014145908.1 hypothetical protein SARC_15445 [Sphaeroforma arctica JP610]